MGRSGDAGLADDGARHAGGGTISTSADHLKECRSAPLDRGVQGRLQCVSFVNGFVRGAGYAESIKPSPGFCPPASASTDQVMDAIEATLRAAPTLGPRPID